MTRTPVRTNRFKKDVELALKRGKSGAKLKGILETLISGERLDPRFRDHALVGNFVGRRECHLEPDWLLVYKLDGDEIIFERTGRHSDLFW